MKIKLDGWYQNLQGVKIAPGIYDNDAPELHQLGQYLIDTGHAVEVNESGKTISPPPDDPQELMALKMEYDALGALYDPADSVATLQKGLDIARWNYADRMVTENRDSLTSLKKDELAQWAEWLELDVTDKTKSDIIAALEDWLVEYHDFGSGDNA